MATEMNVEAERAAPAQPRDYFAWWTSIETDVRKSMLVFAHREPERLHALVRQAYEAGQQSMQAARRAAQSADVGAGELPELPEPCQSVMPSGWIRYTADQMLDYARAALAHKAAPAHAADQDALDAKRYRWLKSRFTGYDFYWMGKPPYEEKEDQGKCVIVFECGENFDAGRDFEKAIDATFAATPVTDQAATKQANQQ